MAITWKLSTITITDNSDMTGIKCLGLKAAVDNSAHTVNLDKIFGLTGSFMVIEAKHSQSGNLLQPDAPLRKTWGAHQ